MWPKYRLKGFTTAPFPQCCREHNPTEADIRDRRQIEVLALAWLYYGSRKVRCAIQHAIALLEDCMPDGMGAMPLIVSTRT